MGNRIMIADFTSISHVFTSQAYYKSRTGNPLWIIVVALVALCICPPAVRADNARVRAEISAAYAKSCAAMGRSDIVGAMAIFGPDYTAVTRFRTLQRHEMEAIWKDMMSLPKVHFKFKAAIEKLTVNGPNAIAVVHYVPPGDGKASTSPYANMPYVQIEDYWAKTANGWMLMHSKELPGSMTTVDGRIFRLPLTGAPMYGMEYDKNGRRTGKRVLINVPPPDRVAHNGLSHVDSYVARFLASKAKSPSLSLFSPDGHRGFGMMRHDGQLLILFFVPSKQEPQKEKAIHHFFEVLKIEPADDYLAEKGETRVLNYPISGDAPHIAALCKKLLKEIYGIQDQEPLDFTLELK